MAKNKPNIQFPKSFVVPQGTFENEDSERVRKQKSLVPLLRALAGPEEDVLTQVVNTGAVLKIYSPTKLMHIVEGVRYGKAEDGTEHLFIGKMEAEKVVNELKGKQFADIIWPLWLAFVASKDDLPDNLSELEKPKAVATPDLFDRYEEALKGLTEISGELLEFKAQFGEKELIPVLKTLHKKGGSYKQDVKQLMESIYLEERLASESKTESAQVSRPSGIQKPDRRNLVEQRNIILAKAYNKAKGNKAEITAATLDNIPWITQDPLLLKWNELSFTGALKTRPGTVKSLFSKTAKRYKLNG